MKTTKATWNKGEGQSHDVCEPNQYDNEIACLQKADCNGDASCQAIIDVRIKQLDDTFDDENDDNSGHFPAP